MRTLHELHIQTPVRHGRLALLPRPLIIGAGVIGGIVVAFVFAVLLAHPAGASTEPTTAVVPAVPAASAAAVSPITKAVLSEVPGPGAGVARPAVSSLTTMRAHVVTHLAAVTDPIVATAPALTESLTELLLPGVAPAVAPAVSTVTPVRPARTIKVSTVVNGHPTTGAIPLSGPKKKVPPAVPPSQRFPLMTGSSPSGDSVPSPGSHAPVVTPGSDPLSPDWAVSRVGAVQSRTPDLLFDVRYARPG